LPDVAGIDVVFDPVDIGIWFRYGSGTRFHIAMAEKVERDSTSQWLRRWNEIPHRDG